MKSPQIISKKIKVNKYEGCLVDSGAMHFCIQVNSIEEISNIETLCKNIRYSQKFMPKGFNVNFFEIVNTDLIKVNTNRVKVFKDTDSCSKLILKGINVSASVRDLIEGSGGKVEE